MIVLGSDNGIHILNILTVDAWKLEHVFHESNCYDNWRLDDVCYKREDQVLKQCKDSVNTEA